MPLKIKIVKMRFQYLLKNVIRLHKPAYHLSNYLIKKYFISKRKIKIIPLYATNKCNSKCKHCNIWKVRTKEDISLQVIEKLLIPSKLTSSAIFLLQGGEFILHPKCEEILTILKQKRMILLSNGLLQDKLLKLVKKFKIQNVQISLDGRPASHNKLRGGEQFYKVFDTIKKLKPITNVRLAYTFTPWNSLEDLLYVKKICKELKVKLYYENVYNYECILQPSHKLTPITIPPNEKSFYLNYYNLWLNHKFKIPCYSINITLVVLPNGLVSICQGKNQIIGDLNIQTLNEIWNSKKNIQIQKNLKSCNSCWLGIHRGFDIQFEQSKEYVKKYNPFNFLKNISLQTTSPLTTPLRTRSKEQYP